MSGFRDNILWVHSVIHWIDCNRGKSLSDLRDRLLSEFECLTLGLSDEELSSIPLLSENVLVQKSLGDYKDKEVD